MTCPFYTSEEENVSIIQSFQKNTQFFVIVAGKKSLIMRHVFLKNAMEYAGYLCNFM